MEELYKIFKKKNCVIGKSVMSYEHFCNIAAQNQFKPYIEYLESELIRQ